MEVSDAPSIAGPGHNLASVTDILKDRFSGLIDEVEALANQANAARDALGTPATVTTDEQRDQLTRLGLDAHKLGKRLDETKLATTKPLRDEVAETNGFFQTLATRPDKIKTAFQQLVGTYDEAKRAAERRKAAEVAEQARQEAQRKLDEAAASSHGVMSDVVLKEASDAEHRAAVLENAALSAGSGPTRTEGGTISRVTKWDFRIVEAAKIDLNKLRAHFSLAEIEKAIRAHVRANRDTAPLAGVEIFPDSKTQFRG